MKHCTNAILLFVKAAIGESIAKAKQKTAF